MARNRKRQRNDVIVPATGEQDQEPQTEYVETDQGTGGSPPSPWLFYLPGFLLLAVGLALAGGIYTMPPVAKAMQTLNLSPGLFAGLGLGLLLGGFILVGLRTLATRIDQVEDYTVNLHEQNEDIRTGLADLGSIDVAAKLAQVASGMAPSEIQASLAKNDEKLNNLTKAVRMLTQPLEETSRTLPEMQTSLGELLEQVKENGESTMAKLDRFDQDLPQLTVKRLTDNLPQHLDPLKQDLASSAQATEEAIQASRDQLEQSVGSLRLSINEELKQEMDLIQSKVSNLEEQGRESLAEIQKLLTSAGQEKPGQEPDFGLEDIQEIRRSLDQLMETVRSLDFKAQQAPAPVAAERSAPSPSPQAPAQPAVQGSSRPKDGKKASVLTSIEKLKRMKGQA